jgi:hypothetical protein
MFIGRFNHFQCNKCKKEIHLLRYGLPDDWVYISKLNGPIEHLCEQCANDHIKNLKNSN